MDETFLTTEEVLDYLQVTQRTVYRLLKAGKLPAVRVGRQWRFRRSDVDAWLAGQGSQATRDENIETKATADGVSADQAHASASTATSEPTGARSREAAGNPRVLVVDDEESIRELLRRTLALVEYDVATMPDAASAIDYLRKQACDLLITDLRMPGMDGLTLIREARRLRPALPVVIITGFSTEANAIEAINLGVSGYLTKPFRVPKVLSVAAKALGE